MVLDSRNQRLSVCIFVEEGVFILIPVCTNYATKEREPGNVSSHDPVQLNLQMQIVMDNQRPYKKQTDIAPRPNWTRIDKES